VGDAACSSLAMQDGALFVASGTMVTLSAQAPILLKNECTSRFATMSVITLGRLSVTCGYDDRSQSRLILQQDDSCVSGVVLLARKLGMAGGGVVDFSKAPEGIKATKGPACYCK
jgi:hypothetical protein